MQPLSGSIPRFIFFVFALSWSGSIAAHYFLGEWAAADPSGWRGYWLSLPATWGPAASAAIVLSSSAGAVGLRRMVAQLRPHRSDMPWLITLPMVGLLLTYMCYVASGVVLPVGDAELGWSLLAAHLIVQLVVVAIGEELGWRGWLLPRLAANRSLFVATILTSAVWLTWHLPKLLGPPSVAIPLAVLIVSSSFLLSLIWWLSGGRVLVVAVAHAAINAPIFWVEWSGVLTEEELLRGWRGVASVYAVLAVITLFLPLWRRDWQRTATAEHCL